MTLIQLKFAAQFNAHVWFVCYICVYGVVHVTHFMLENERLTGVSPLTEKSFNIVPDTRTIFVLNQQPNSFFNFCLLS